MNLEFHYNGDSKKKTVSTTFSIDNILTEFKSLFDVKNSTLKLEDLELNLVSNDGAFIKLQNTSQLFPGAVVDIQCLNDEGLSINNNNDNNNNNNQNNNNNNNNNTMTIYHLLISSLNTKQPTGLNNGSRILTRCQYHLN